MSLKDVLNVEVPNDFGCDGADDYMNDVMYEFIDSLHRLNCFEFDYAYGASQFCIIPANSDIVVKLPFTGMYYCEEDEDEVYFDPFYTDNYCEVAVNIYEDAINAGVEAIFAETSFLGFSKNGHPMYTQPRIGESVSEGIKHSGSKDSSDYVMKKRDESGYDNTYWRLNFDWLATAVDYYGAEYMDKVLNFIKNHDRIDDLHEGNYGWMPNGAPIIFDYAGFDY